MSKTDYWQVPLTLFLIALPFAGFLGIELHFVYNALGGHFLTILFLLVAFAVASLLAAAFSDPGVLPRSQLARDYDADSLPPLQTAAITIAGQEASIKYCHTCGIWRPPRSSHCSYCNHCIGNTLVTPSLLWPILNHFS